MALQLFDGFEQVGAGNATILRNGITSGGTPIGQTGRDGVGRGMGGAGGTASTLVPFVTPAAVAIVGFGLKVTGYGLSNAGNIIRINGDGGITNHLTIRADITGHLLIDRNSTILQTSALTLPGTNVWFYIEIKATIADAGGTCIVKVDGVEHLNFTGDTKNAGTATTVSALGLPTSFHVDDLYICDGTGSAPYNDFLGERVVKAKRPVGNGAVSDLVGSDGDSTDNYLLIDDDPLNTTDYVASNVAAARDLYDLGAATGLTSVDAVQVVSYDSKSDSGSRSVKHLLRSSAGTVDVGPTVALSTSWTVHQGAVEQLNPDGAAWTPANVNQIQAGIEVV